MVRHGMPISQLTAFVSKVCKILGKLRQRLCKPERYCSGAGLTRQFIAVLHSFQQRVGNPLEEPSRSIINTLFSWGGVKGLGQLTPHAGVGHACCECSRFAMQSSDGESPPSPQIPSDPRAFPWSCTFCIEIGWHSNLLQALAYP